jgi:acetoin utilization deacetylase AcuC-like enzyme
MRELVMIEQRHGREDAALWVREGERRLPGCDGNRRLLELSSGLLRHPRVRGERADARPEAVEATLRALHEASYLEALEGVRDGEAVVMADFAPPGLEPDIPVSAGLVAAAREAVRTAITAAERLAAGRRFAYAVCRPPGHHAGPDWLAGYCYLNSAAAAVHTLRAAGVGPVGVLDLDLHYPNGTAALVDRISGATLHSLHAAPVTNVAPGTVLPWAAGERALAFAAEPSEREYLEEVESSLEMLAAGARALVVSLGYDTVGGDPHGDWGFSPGVFAEVGRLLARADLPVCVIQEGGYALDLLADCAHAFASGLLGAPAAGDEPTASRMPFVTQRATKGIEVGAEDDAEAVAG